MHVELIIPDYLIYFILILIIYNLYNQISLNVHTKFGHAWHHVLVWLPQNSLVTNLTILHLSAPSNSPRVLTLSDFLIR